MSDKIASLYAELSADTKPLEEALKRAKASLTETGQVASKSTADFQKMADEFTRLGGDLSNTQGAMDSWIGQLRAATPANAELAYESGKVVEQFKEGKISAAQAADALEQLKAKANGTDTAMGRLKNGLKEFGRGVAGAVESITGLSIGQLTLAGGMVAAANAAKGAVTDYMAYADAMDKLSMATGVSIDQVSRLVQVADDVRIEQGAVENAFKLAVQNGFVPTIDNLAKLSDRYNSIQSPIQRAAEMQAIFGRSWKDLVPLLQMGGDALRKATDEMDASMIVTQKQAEEARKAAKALDDWGDAITGVKNSFANGFLPIMTDVINVLLRADKVTKESGSGWMRYIPILGSAQAIWAGIAGATQQDTDAKQGNTGAVERNTAAVMDNSAELAAAQEITDDSGREAAVMRRQVEQMTGAYKDNSAAIWESIRASDGYKSALKGIADAQANLASAQQNFNQSFGDKVVGKLEAAGLKAEDYYTALGKVDEQLGTNYQAQYDANKALDEAIKGYKNDKDVSRFGDALGKNKSAWEKLDEGINQAKRDLAEARQAFNNFIQTMAAANGMRFTLYVDTAGGSGNDPTKHGAVGRAGDNADVAESITNRKAAGGPVWQGQPVITGERGREVFVPPSNGYILSAEQTQAATTGGNGGITINSLTVNTQLDYQALLYKLEQDWRRKVH